jgi:predicted  nucleic acid-binding Zn ribbon protein
MHTAEITVRFQQADRSQAVGEALTALLACWYKNGQVNATPSAFAQTAALQVNAYAMLPEAESLDPKWDGVYVRQCFAQLHAMNCDVSITILGKDPEALDACSCATPSSLLMYTHYLSVESPLRCGDCFLPRALYRLPFTRDQEYFDWRSWQVNYRSCDALQMQCTVGERYHERQLFDPKSDLNRAGLDLRAALHRLIDRPVFYFLHKSRGRTKASESKRRCPVCDSAWLLDQRWHLFDFRCDTCMLLSNVAVTR